MRAKSNSRATPGSHAVKDNRRCRRRQYSAEEKIWIFLVGLQRQNSIAELCRREALARFLYYDWWKEFLEAGLHRLAGDTARATTTDEVKSRRIEACLLYTSPSPRD